MNDRKRDTETRSQHHADPDHAATDPRAAANQEQIRADHEALEESSRRVQATAREGHLTTDPAAAAAQDRVRADHDALQESARRVESSVSAEVRDTPVQPAHFARATENTAELESNAREARDNADALRESARELDSDSASRDRNRN